MNQPLIESIRALKNADRIQVASLFTSDRIYWLTASVATGFALAELQDSEGRDTAVHRDEEMLRLFTDVLREGAIDDDAFARSRERTLNNLDGVATYLNRHCVFNARQALPVCAGFVSYWLFAKLIELEWQRVLERDDEKDTYMFLDGVIADQEELATIREKVAQHEALFDDELVYLRTHWESASDFFMKLKNALILLDRGLIPFVVQGR